MYFLKNNYFNNERSESYEIYIFNFEVLFVEFKYFPKGLCHGVPPPLIFYAEKHCFTTHSWPNIMSHY